MAKPEAIEKAKTFLSEDELEAYNKYMEKANPPLSPTVSANLFNLFLNGMSCTEIQKINKNFTLGMIVRARVEGLWDERRAVYQAELYDGVVERVKQAQTEAAVFAADLLAAAHKQYGEKLRKYLQTGDEKELGDLSVKSLDGYRKVIEMLLKITGQDSKQTQTIKGEVKHEHVVTAQGKPLSPEQAAAFLAIVEKDDKK